jgi:hypothetical protein
LSSGSKFGFGPLVQIPNPKTISQPSPIAEPLMINAPMPIPEPFVLPSSTVATFTFEDSNMVGWVPVDEPPQLLGAGPSRWMVDDGPISGKALIQTREIWGDKQDVVALGTFVIYDLLELYDFTMEFDAVIKGNDAIGMVWGWKSRTDHFRFLTMINSYHPSGAPPDKKGPFSVIERRTSDGSPYYITRAIKKETSINQDEVTHYKLELSDKVAKVYWNGVPTLQVRLGGYMGGKVGFTIYSPHDIVYFDNVRIEAVVPEPIDQMYRYSTMQR